MLRLTDHVSRAPIKETFHLDHEWLAYFREFMQYFLCKCALCYDILGHISSVLFQKHLQMSYLCPRPWYCMNPIHHPHVITAEGTPHLECGEKMPCGVVLHGDTLTSFLACLVALFTPFPFYPVSISHQVTGCSGVLFIPLHVLSAGVKRKIEESYISLCDQHNSCYELEK